MTEENLLDRVTGDSSRRSFLKKGALTSAGLALGASGAGTAAAQDDSLQEEGQGFMFPNQFVANARFTVDAQIDWSPQAGGDEGGDGGDEGDEGALQDAGQDQIQTYVIQYDFSDSHYAFLFVPGGAGGDEGDDGNGDDGGDDDEGGDTAGNVGAQSTQLEEGQTYRLASEVNAADQSLVQGAVVVTFSPVNGDDTGTDDEGGDDGGDDGGDEGDEGGNGGDDGGDNGDDGDDGGNESG